MFRRGGKHVIHRSFMLDSRVHADPRRRYASPMTTLRKQLMTTDEFLAWAERQSERQGIGNSGCLPLCSCMSTAVSIAAVPA
jgi:hypothetical protein